MVNLICIKVGSRLRVRITSLGYKNDANCQFPRAIRAEGVRYKVDPVNIRLIQRGSTYFYSIKNGIEVLSPEIVIVEADSVGELKIFGESGECCICMDAQKDIVFNPCGHLVSCKSCATQLTKGCPLCRQPIVSFINYADLT